jgi:hypothetical protein
MVRETPNYDRNDLGIFDITVNDVLVHSRKCDTRSYGVPGHLWLRDEQARQNDVWQAISSAAASHDSQDAARLKKHVRAGCLKVLVRSSSYGAKHLDAVVEMIRGWFHKDWLEVKGVIDDGSAWNFEITVGGVLLHSRNILGHGFFYDDWSQQNLIWRAISDISSGVGEMAAKGA